jgi:saccharopine dehydrogenase (NAD+, L-lysine-forming)
VAETRRLDKAALLAHDILVNAVYVAGPVTPFVTPADLGRPRRLATVADVTCDAGSAHNTLPIYDATTDWRRPVRRLSDGPPPLDLIAIDNLPSLLPKEASIDFSANLTPHLLDLTASPWERCRTAFRSALRAVPDSAGVGHE